MNWLIFALISSGFVSLRELAIKRVGENIPVVIMSWAMNLFMFLIFLTVNILLKNFPDMDKQFIQTLMLASVLDSLAMVLYLGAIRMGNLSQSVPMLCFIPVVQVFVTPVMVHEQLTPAGIAGVLLVVSGSYLLNLENVTDVLSPFRQIFHVRSTWMMLLVAVLWGISSSFHKIGVTRTNSLHWGMCEMAVISLVLLPVAIRISKTRAFAWRKTGRAVIPSIFSSVAVLTYYLAISMGPVAYVSSVRRLGVLFSMTAGILVLKEGMAKHGIAGALVMIAGAVIISLFG